MRRLALFLIAVMVLSVIPLAGIPRVAASVQQTAKINPTDDTWIDEGGWVDYKTYRLRVGTYYGSEERPYLKFNISKYVPKAAVILKATLNLHAYYHYGSLSHNVSVYGVLDDNWDETTLRWSNQPTDAVGPLSWVIIDLPNGNVNVDYSWDVTDFVADQLLKDGVVSFYLHSNNSHVNTKDYIYFASKENKYNPWPELEIEYYVPIAVKELQVPNRAIQNYDNKIKVVLENGGKAAQNVTFLLYIDDKSVINETIELPAGGDKTVEYIWNPAITGKHEIKAEIEGYDFKSKEVDVIPNPNKIARIMSTYYLSMYTKEWKSLNPLYENFTQLLEEVRQYNISMGEFESQILSVEGQLQLVKQEYQKYITLKRYSEATGSTSLSFAAMRHIRKAAFLSRGIKDKLEYLIPLMQSAVKKAESGQTGVTIKVTKVLIDASHNQYYNPTKSDSNGMNTLIGKIENDLGWKVDINTEPITYEKLKNYNVLIITNPSKDITDEEAQAIQQFVENGGGLFILGESYYGHVYYKSLNKVVGKYGIEFKDDELMDDDKNTGRSWFPLVGLYNLEHPAMKFLNETHEMLYNGDTLDISGNAVWLITGYETAYAEDKDKNVVKEKGSKPIVAAAVEVGSGRVVAYGSSKAISDAYYQRYINTNWPFVKGVLLWLAHAS